MTTRQELLDSIEKFLVEHSITATDFGLTALRDRSFVHRLRQGADIRLSTVERVTKWMERQEKKAQRRRAVAA